MFTGLSAGAETLATFQEAVGRYNPHSLSGVNDMPVPLVSVRLSASTDLMKGRALDVVASYRSIGFDQQQGGLHYNELSKEFSVTAPQVKSLDFSRSIREHSNNSPEKMFDKMIVDGAVSLNFQW